MSDRYSMLDVKYNLGKIHSVEGVTLQNAYGRGTVRCVDAGLLYIPSGEIVMGDPERKYAISELRRKTFSVPVIPGNYPVSVHLVKMQSEEQIAFVEVRFSNTTPVSYEKAVSVFDAENNRRGLCGYIVNDCKTGLMDSEVFKINSNNPKKTNWESVIVFDWDDYDDFLLDDGGASLPYCVGFSEKGELNAIRLEVQSGCYYWYWGKDKEGKVCCLIGDFFTYV